jgi:hypothetical protein
MKILNKNIVMCYPFITLALKIVIFYSFKSIDSKLERFL